MDCALTNILGLMFTTCLSEFTQKYQYLPYSLITDFMNLSNQMLPELKWAPCGPFYTHFDTLVVDKLGTKHAQFKDVFFLEVSRFRNWPL